MFHLVATLALAFAVTGAPASAQVQSVDTDTAIDADLDPDRMGQRPWIANSPNTPGPAPGAAPAAVAAGAESPAPALGSRPSARYVSPTARPAPPALITPAVTTPAAAAAAAAAAASAPTGPTPASPAASEESTYGQDDLIGAAEGVFGKGAEGLARLIEDVFARQGRPNGYIVGREAGGAIVFGVRYGSGTLHHKIEGNMPVYWTGPSVGFDLGANAANTFVLVYNLYDTNDLFARFPAGEGQAYFVGGFHAGYLRRGDVVLIPIRVGAGLRLGVNAGYMRFSRQQRWLPF